MYKPQSYQDFLAMEEDIQNKQKLILNAKTFEEILSII